MKASVVSEPLRPTGGAGWSRRALLGAAGGWGLGAAWAQPPSRRLISVGGGITEVFFALGLQHLLVGTDSTSLYPLAAQATPKVGYMRQLSAEGVLSLRPHALVASADAGPPLVLEQIRSAGVQVERVASEHNWDDLRRKVAAVGRVTQQQASAARLQQQLDKRWAAVQEQLQRSPRQPGPRVLFVLAHGASPLVSGEQTAAHAMIGLIGARNALSGFAGYRPMTSEALARAAPDTILTTTQGLLAQGGADRFWQRPELALTPAFRRRRHASALVHLDALELLGFGPRLPDVVLRLHQRVVLA
ncbi:ABC transporter substrate-binding protein [Hydrogenophaga sp.]|uniref:heme/hemin ABC transporter substrate-binding protein n=1 Tax=Hydrogenophaga sp. TaxID=1904254 RepID=UPI0019853F23|nr:ABC transporter substrate-binding protein [Hydrogenophaga sp.]MBD3892693.1 ABC transporter substrate-binding protein [Hydrogenophaga sp.]